MASFTMLLIAVFTFSPFAYAQENAPAPEAALPPTVEEVVQPAGTVDEIVEQPPVSSVQDEVVPPLVDIVTIADSATESAQDTQTASSTPDEFTNADVSVQTTAEVQEAVTGTLLEGTANPESATSTEADVIPLVEATTTEPVIEEMPIVAPEVMNEPAPIELPLVEEPLPVTESLTPTVAAVVENIEQKEEDPAYVIELTGKTIPTKKKEGLGSTDIVSTPSSIVAGAGETMTVSGACSSPYFVVLLFKNQTDYELDPRSFILNKAFPCSGGQYSYSVERLPATLPNGTYYLMVGEQGDTGPWVPASGLTEITINRSN